MRNPMVLLRRSVPLALFGMALISWTSFGQAQQETTPTPPQEKPGKAEQIGAAIDRTARVLSRRAKDLSANVEATLNRARGEIQNFGVEARITGRLLWDKDLQDSRIELEVKDQGVTVLRGTVPNANARRKAVMLTQDTIGVSEVVDELKVVPPSEEPASESVDNP